MKRVKLFRLIAAMAALAKKAWLVKGDKLSPWPGKQDE